MVSGRMEAAFLYMFFSAERLFQEKDIKAPL
jgi:hypothetical protein